MEPTSTPSPIRSLHWDEESDSASPTRREDNDAVQHLERGIYIRRSCIRIEYAVWNNLDPTCGCTCG